jgi:hypothetical protein
MDSRGFFVAKMPQKCTETQRRCPTEKRREQERRCVGNRSGDAAGTAARNRIAVNPQRFFWREEKAKKWYIKVVT